jgi:hypothetical protein
MGKIKGSTTNENVGGGERKLEQTDASQMSKDGFLWQNGRYYIQWTDNGVTCNAAVQHSISGRIYQKTKYGLLHSGRNAG